MLILRAGTKKIAQAFTLKAEELYKISFVLRVNY